MPCRKVTFPLLMLGLTVTQCGCTNEQQVDGTTIYSFAAWVGAIVLIFGYLIYAIGAVLLTQTVHTILGWILLIVGPIICLVFAPGLFLDRATVNNDRFTLRVGFWFTPTRHEVVFAHVASIQVEVEERRTRRGGVTQSFFLLCHMRGGGSARVPVGDLMKQGAAARILDIARRRNIPVVGNL